LFHHFRQKGKKLNRIDVTESNNNNNSETLF
jgi:hypothetical protein